MLLVEIGQDNKFIDVKDFNAVFEEQQNLINKLTKDSNKKQECIKALLHNMTESKNNDYIFNTYSMRMKYEYIAANRQGGISWRKWHYGRNSKRI